ncbi:hypothetical protein BAPKO_0443 [Borreliella afzelii PKo]|nr:hypothetical protein BAPKO_0443 [Borreliella afzelii PKo]
MKNYKQYATSLVSFQNTRDVDKARRFK